jgi:hypothetical protein
MIEYPKVRELKEKRQEKDPDLGTRYLPSTGSEGMWFEEKHCPGCRYYVKSKQSDEYDCSRGIILKAYAADPSDRSTWPKQWRENPEGPVCTARREREGRKRDDRAAYEEAMKR